jgi:hypothetical protein
MVAVRCHKCNKVQLLSQDEFDYEMSKGGVYCESRECIEKPKFPRGNLMSEISIQNFKCDNPNCGIYFRRSNEDEGYYCISTTVGEKGIMVNPSASVGSRKFVCRKVCALKHCGYLNGEMKGKCAVLRAYEKQSYLFEADIKRICAECIASNKRVCQPGCEAYTSIDKCSKCNYSSCRPRPHTLEFNKDWVSACPKCNTGRIRLVENSTFANYIRASFAFNMDNGASFCDNLLAESDKVAEIKLILKSDDLNKRD